MSKKPCLRILRSNDENMKGKLPSWFAIDKYQDKQRFKHAKELTNNSNLNHLK